jgi:hypothetical protein
LALNLSRARIDWQGALPQFQTIAVSSNFAEPFPYAVRVVTVDGGAWVSANRVTGLIGEPLTLTVNPAGLPPGTYQGTVSVILAGTGPQQVDVPVSLTLP